MKLVYPAIFTPFKGSHGYTVEVPDLPGCVTEGSSLIEAIEMGEDAASGWILDEIEDGNDYPAPSQIQDLHYFVNRLIFPLVLDMDTYTKKYGSKVD